MSGAVMIREVRTKSGMPPIGALVYIPTTSEAYSGAPYDHLPPDFSLRE